jgi:hypothetical protein
VPGAEEAAQGNQLGKQGPANRRDPGRAAAAPDEDELPGRRSRDVPGDRDRRAKPGCELTLGQGNGEQDRVASLGRR